MKITGIRLSFLALCIFLFSGMILSQDMKPEAGKLFNEGNKLLKEGNYNGAVEKYNSALAIDKDYRIYYQKGIALKSSQKYDDAKEAFNNVINAKKDFEAAYNALGGVYFAQGNYEKAAENFEKVLEFSKNNTVKNKIKKNLSLAYTKIGQNAITSGNSAKAIENLKKAVENNNEDEAYLLLAKLYTELGNYDSALDAAQKALKYKASISKGGPYFYMGIAYKNKGDNAKAKEMFNQAKADASYRQTAEYELSLIK